MTNLADRELFESAGEALLAESGCTVVKWRDSLSGVAKTKSKMWEIEVPRPTTALRFGVFAHEVGHQVLRHTRRVPRWVEESEAEKYALAQFDRFDLPGKEEYAGSVGRHLAHSYRKAIRRGGVDLDRRIESAYPELWVLAKNAPNGKRMLNAIEDRYLQEIWA